MVVRRRHSNLLRVVALFLAAVPLALLAGCTLARYPQSTLNPHSDYAWAIQRLLEAQVFWVVIIFVVVETMLVFAVIRFRAKPGAPDPKPVHGNTALEVAWTIAPAIILALIAVPTVLTIFATQANPPKDALHVRVIGHQWWWEFQYPDLGVVTAGEMHVPKDKNVIVEIETADVIHSFWFPVIGGKRDAVPARTNRLWFKADTLGTFPGQCAELCGLSHANMRMRLMIETPGEFDAWVARMKSAPPEPDSTSLAGQGKQIFSQSACIGCHTIDGVSAGIVGPNLTHVGGRTSIAGSIFENTPENMSKWILDAPGRKPGTLMPNLAGLGIAAEQVPAIVAYLQSLK